MTKKNLEVLILLSLISVFIFLITGCSSDSEDTLSSARSYDVNFEVTDTNESPQKVEAASLTLAGETKKTNAAGTVSFRKADGKYKYEVSAQGYKYFSDYIVVKGADTIKLVKLISLTQGGSEPGDEDDNDTIPPSLFKLFGWINERFQGVEEISSKNLEDIVGDLDQSFDYLIVYFSEKVKTEAELKQGEDFEVHLISVEPNEKIIIEDAFFNLNTEFLVLKIDQRYKLDSYTGLIKLEITDEGREKITDIAGNMLAEDPDTLDLQVK